MDNAWMIRMALPTRSALFSLTALTRYMPDELGPRRSWIPANSSNAPEFVE